MKSLKLPSNEEFHIQKWGLGTSLGLWSSEEFMVKKIGHGMSFASERTMFKEEPLMDG